MKTINLFHFYDKYYFKHYFQEGGLFDELRSYYDSLNYRFEVGEESLEEVKDLLQSHGFGVNIVEREEVREFVVIINKYEKHADLLKKAVDTLEVGEKKALVMKDQVSKEEALNRGEEPDEEWIDRL